jgi:hypothetical protein
LEYNTIGYDTDMGGVGEETGPYEVFNDFLCNARDAESGIKSVTNRHNDFGTLQERCKVSGILHS